MLCAYTCLPFGLLSLLSLFAYLSTTLDWWLDVLSALVWWIPLDEGRKLVGVVKITLPTAGHATSLDDAFPDNHKDFRQVAILTTDVLLDEFIKQSLEYNGIMVTIYNSTFPFRVFVGVGCLCTKLITK